MSKIVVTLVYPVSHRYKVADIQRLAMLVSGALRGMVCIGILLGLVIVAQFAYPRHRTRPFLRIADRSYGFASIQRLQTSTRTLEQQPITLQLNQNVYSVSMQQLGIVIDTDQLNDQALNYSWKQRLVPFSILSRGDSLRFSYLTDEAKQNAYIDLLISKNYVAAKNANTVKNPSGVYILESEKSGVEYDRPIIKRALSQLNILIDQKIEIPGKVILPKVTNTNLQPVIDQINTIGNQDIIVSFAAQSIKLSGLQIRDWASVSIDELSGVAGIAYDRPGIEAWLRANSVSATQVANPLIIYKLDGVVQRQEAGKPGVALDVATSVETIMDAVNKKKTEAKAVFTPVRAGQRTVSSYSPTDLGVQTLINDWQVEHKNAKTAVYFHEIGGKNRAANNSADSSFFSASLYKLFITHFLFSGINSNTINPSEQIINGMDVNACIQAMIVVSNNICAVTIVDRYGWNAINNFMQTSGFGASSVAGGNVTVTARSVGGYLERLQAGVLLNPADTSTMLNYMGQQKYRAAIPTGVPGVLVQDKVGFYGSTWHDAAIVHSPKTTYVLVVLSQGVGSSGIADLARRIEAIL